MTGDQKDRPSRELTTQGNTHSKEQSEPHTENAGNNPPFALVEQKGRYTSSGEYPAYYPVVLLNELNYFIVNREYIKNSKRKSISVVPSYAEIFHDKDYETAFTNERALHPSIIDLWCSKIVGLAIEFGGDFPVVADLGCGTGRFSIPLAMALDCICGNVVAVDNSEVMLEGLKRRIFANSIRNLTPLNADITNLKLPIPVHIFFASEVLHSVPSLATVFKCAAATSAKESAFVIRVPSHNQLRDITWLRFFPSALGIDIARTPDIATILSNLDAEGFRGPQEVFEIIESQTLDADRFVLPLKDKAFSILRLIPSVEYDAGIKAAEDYALETKFPETNHNLTCLVVRRKQ